MHTCSELMASSTVGSRSVLMQRYSLQANALQYAVCSRRCKLMLCNRHGSIMR